MKADAEANLTELVRAIVRKEMDNNKKAVGAKGGNKVISSDGDIRLITHGSGKVWINDMYFKENDGVFEIHVPDGKWRVVPI